MDTPIVFRLRPREKALLVAHLARLCEHGSDPSELWRAAQLGMLSGTFRKHAERIALALSNGMALSDALARFPRSFAHWELALVRSGERANCVHRTLLAWHEMLTRTLAAHTSSRRSFGYATSVAIVALTSMFTMSSAVRGTIWPISVESGAHLSLFTQFFALHGDVLVLLLVPAGFLLVAGWWWVSQWRSEGRLLALGILDVAVRSGMPIHEALGLAAGVQRIRHDRRELESLSRRLRDGQALGTARGRLLDASTLRLLDTALRSQDGAALPGLVDHARFAAERSQRRAVELLHDVLVLGLGAVVAFILIGCWPAYFSPGIDGIAVDQQAPPIPGRRVQRGASTSEALASHASGRRP